MSVKNTFCRIAFIFDFSKMKPFKIQLMKNKTFLFFFLACLLSGQVIAQNPCDLSSGLTGYFPFNGNAQDASPNAINGAGYSLTPTTGRDGVTNSAFHFNGSSSWVDCSTDNRGITNQVSICAWVKTTDTAFGQWVAGKYSFDEEKGYAMTIGNSQNGFIGQVAIGGRDGTGNYHASGYSTTKVNDGNWHCLVGIAANQSWEIYVDGNLENSTAGSTVNLATSTNEPFTIGWHTNPNFPFWMNGDLDNVRVYNRALTECEIDSLCPLPCNPNLALGLTGDFFFAGNADDASPTAINGVVTNAVLTAGHDGLTNSAYQFDGSSTSIDCGIDNRGITNAVSVSAWIRTTEQQYGQWVAGQYDGPFADNGYLISIGDVDNNSLGRVAFSGRDGTGIYQRSGFSSTLVNDGAWHCLVGSAGNNEWKIYVDGSLESTSLPGSTTFNLGTAFNPFTIGRISSTNLPPLWMNGDIDNVRVYNRVLTECEIDSLCPQIPIVSVKNEVFLTGQLQLYPNPAQDQVVITWQENTPRHLSLTDLYGRSVRSFDELPNTRRLEVPLEGLPPGTYFLIWQNDTGEMHSRPLVKM